MTPLATLNGGQFPRRHEVQGVVVLTRTDLAEAQAYYKRHPARFPDPPVLKLWSGRNLVDAAFVDATWRPAR